MRGNRLAHLRGVGGAAQVGRARAVLEHRLDGGNDRVVGGASRPWPCVRKSSINAPDQIIAIGLAMFLP